MTPQQPLNHYDGTEDGPHAIILMADADDSLEATKILTIWHFRRWKVVDGTPSDACGHVLEGGEFNIKPIDGIGNIEHS